MHPLHLLNPPQTPIYKVTQQLRIVSQLTNKVPTLLALFIACTGVHCGLKYQHWPMKRTLFVDQKSYQWRTVLI